MALATTVFAVVDGVLFKPIELPASGRLFTVRAGFKGQAPPAGYQLVPVSTKDLQDWSAATPGALFTGFSATPLVGFGTGVNDYNAGVVSVQPNVFDVLGVRPLIGGFEAADFERDALMVPVIVTYPVWQGRFLGDPNILGRTVVLDPVTHRGFRIVGVMPRGFVFPTENTDVKFIRPFDQPSLPASDPTYRRIFEVIARAPVGIGTEALGTRIEAAMTVTAAAFPALGPKPAGASDAGWRRRGPFDRADIQPLSVTLGSRSRPLFSAVFMAVVVLVAIGALNVSGLMAARTLDRGRELGVRRALGASRASVAKLVFVEALVLIGAGSFIGLAATRPLLGLALSLLPEEVVLLKPPAIDWRVSAFVIVGAVLLAIPTALWPIRRALASKAARTVHGDAGRASERTRSVGRFAVVAAQVAGGFVLTLGGALVVGSLLAVYSNDIPIRTDDVILVDVELQGPSGGNRGPSPERNARVGPLLDRVRQVPGVSSVAITSGGVLTGGGWESQFRPPEGALKLPPRYVDVHAVTPDYYRTVQPQLVAGRLPTDEELARNARVIVVSERVAAAYWPLGSAVGRPLIQATDPEPYAVVGVVKDVRWSSWDVETASIYGPYALLSRGPFPTFLVRSQGRPGPVMAEVLRALEAPNLLVKARRAGMLDDLFVDSVRPRRFQAWLFGSFAAAGLTIVGVGILGLLAMATARRVKEVGIRHALGATPFGIVRMLLREQLWPVVAGLAAGAVISAWAVTLVEKYVYQVTTHDARVWAATAVLIITTAAIGALVPAVRASRTDPVQALRLD
jgi:predicted permease